MLLFGAFAKKQSKNFVHIASYFFIAHFIQKCYNFIKANRVSQLSFIFLFPKAQLALFSIFKILYRRCFYASTQGPTLKERG
ncbi:MAG: hypothetical protein Q4F79_05735 [Eubacteriales bacterium]|nr:hypothetical protein [Eubacteriales bacterium]